MKIFSLRIGDKYGPEYEIYLDSKLKEIGHEITWIREPFDPRVALQWNKMFFMNLDIDEPIVVMDCDLVLMNNYEELFDHPIKRGEFLTIKQWWENTEVQTINGGFFKYYPKDCKYIYEKFMKDIDFWQSYYIKNRMTVGPVNGEQNFVEAAVRERLKIVMFDEKWCVRWTKDTNANNYYQKLYRKYYKQNLFQGGSFNKDVKLIHFTYSLNKPHENELFKHLYDLSI